MRSLSAWYLLLVGACVVLPYLLRLQPARRRDWTFLSVTIAFLTWLLLGFAFLHSR
jgi:hypothetical protein